MIAEVFLIGVQSTAVSLLRQMSSFIGGDESWIGCPEVLTVGNGAAEILDGGAVFRSRHIQIMQQGWGMVMRVLHGCEIRPVPGSFQIRKRLFLHGLFFHSLFLDSLFLDS